MAELALLQLMICAGVVILLTMLTGRSGPVRPAELVVPQRGDHAISTRVADAIVLVIFVCIAVFPLFAILWRGIGPQLVAVLAWPAFWRATLTSLAIALLSGVLATGILFSCHGTVEARGGRSRGLAARSCHFSLSRCVSHRSWHRNVHPVANIRRCVPAGAVPMMLGNMLVALPFSYPILEGRLACRGRDQLRRT